MRGLAGLLLGTAVFTLAFCTTGRTISAPASQVPRRQTVIVVVGAGGTEHYGEQFAQWAGLWEQACSKGGAEFIGIGLVNLEGESDRAKLEKVLIEQSRQTETALWLVLIGHGTFDGRTAKFNLRGPDISGAELGQWLEGMLRPTAIINSASSSAPFLSKLSLPGRVVITATKSGFEQNYTRFGGYIAEAVIDPDADLDKDGQTSLLEAFLTASHETSEFYSSGGRLSTEHALLDDNGDALGTRADWFRGIRPVQGAADGADLDGYRAHQFHLLRSDTERNMAPDIRAERDRLELEVMELRDARARFSEQEYFSKLQPLLTRIARIYELTDKSPQTSN